MARAKAVPRRNSPGESLESRENRLILLATNLVEKRLKEGTASSQEVTHFLKLGTTRERLEQERIRNENALSQAKKANLEAERRRDEIYEKALTEFRSYIGTQDREEYYEDYDD